MRLKNISVNNYKSLVDFSLKGLSPLSILYGDNNAGKSNVLELISIIFKRKKQFTGEELTDQLINFYTGVLEDFNYSFFENDINNEISFEIELVSNSKNCNIPEAEFKKLFGKSIKDELDFVFEGFIKQTENSKNLALFEIERIQINGVVAYSNEEKKGIHFFPDLDAKKEDQSRYNKLFESAIEQYDDCVFFVPSHRDMLPIKFGSELEEVISPVKFKQFLYSLSLNEEQYEVFERINKIFNSEPFSFGNISFSKVDDELEIMIQKDGIRLPIKSLGSGVLQILYIVSCIIYSKKEIICLEELEQNLSPKNQELAIKKLKGMIKTDEAPNQIIISSHSPYFYEKNDENSSYLLAKEGPKTVIKARNGEYPKKDSDYDKKEVQYWKAHFPDVQDFY